MGRPPADDPRVFPICVRLTQSELARLDERRGSISASEFIRRLLFGRKR